MFLSKDLFPFLPTIGPPPYVPYLLANKLFRAASQPLSFLRSPEATGSETKFKPTNAATGVFSRSRVFIASSVNFE